MVVVERIEPWKEKAIEKFANAVENIGLKVNFRDEETSNYLINHYLNYNQLTREETLAHIKSGELKNYNDISCFSLCYETALVNWVMRENINRRWENCMNEDSNVPSIDCQYCVTSPSFQNYIKFMLKNIHNSDSRFVAYNCATILGFDSKPRTMATNNYLKSLNYDITDHFVLQNFIIDSFDMYPETCMDNGQLAGLKKEYCLYDKLEKETSHYNSMSKKRLDRHQWSYRRAYISQYDCTRRILDINYNLAKKYRDKDKENGVASDSLQKTLDLVTVHKKN